ncbi:MAG: hypothetical protein AB3N28_01880 [Kordiimonas sp.]
MIRQGNPLECAIILLKNIGFFNQPLDTFSLLLKKWRTGSANWGGVMAFGGDFDRISLEEIRDKLFRDAGIDLPESVLDRKMRRRMQFSAFMLPVKRFLNRHIPWLFLLTVYVWLMVQAFNMDKEYRETGTVENFPDILIDQSLLGIVGLVLSGVTIYLTMKILRRLSSPIDVGYLSERRLCLPEKARPAVRQMVKLITALGSDDQNIRAWYSELTTRRGNECIPKEHWNDPRTIQQVFYDPNEFLSPRPREYCSSQRIVLDKAEVEEFFSLSSSANTLESEIVWPNSDIFPTSLIKAIKVHRNNIRRKMSPEMKVLRALLLCVDVDEIGNFFAEALREGIVDNSEKARLSLAVYFAMIDTFPKSQEVSIERGSIMRFFADKTKRLDEFLFEDGKPTPFSEALKRFGVDGTPSQIDGEHWKGPLSRIESIITEDNMPTKLLTIYIVKRL